MKKKYEKPQIHFVSFELSQDISAGCELITNYAENACAIYVNEPGWDLTVYADSSCGYTPPNVAAGDTPCYHAPTDSYNVYSS